MINTRQLAALLLTCLLFVGFTRAADTVVLKPNQQPGDTFTFDQTMSMQLNIKASSGGQLMQNMQQTMMQGRAGKVQVLEAQHGEVTKATVTFDANCGGSMEQNGQKQPAPFSLAGKSVTITRQADGSYTPDAPVDPEAAKELDGYVRIDNGMYPKTPVAVGESWDIAPEELAKALQMQQGNDGKAKGKLLKLSTVNGRQIADVDVNINFSGEQPGAGKMTLTLSGVAQIDVATGRTIGGQLGGPLTINGQQQANGQVIDIQGDGQISFNTKGVVSGGGNAPVINPNPNPIPNPLNPGAVADFKGTFSNDKLTLTLDTMGANSSGKIVMGAKEFTCSGSVMGNTLTGKFTSGTSEFPFTATLNGDAMNFKTGSTSYDLVRKSVAKNPLE